MVVFSNLNINFFKYEIILGLKREFRRLISVKRKNGSIFFMYVFDYKIVGMIIRVVYTFCFGVYVRFNIVSRFKFC